MNIVGITGQMGSGKDTVADRLVEEHGYTKIALADPIKRFGREVFGFTDTQLWGPSENRNKLDERYDHYCRLRSTAGKLFDKNTNLNTLMNTVDCDAGWLGAARALQEYGDEWLQEVLPGADVNTLYEWMQALGSLHPRLSPRIMLQHLGTEWGRQVADQDIWVNCMLRNATLVLEGHAYLRSLGVSETEGSAPRPVGVVVSDVRFANELQAIKNAGGKLIRVRRKSADGNALKTGIKGHASEAEQQSFEDNDFNVIIHNNKSMEELLKNVDKIVRVL